MQKHLLFSGLVLAVVCMGAGYGLGRYATDNHSQMAGMPGMNGFCQAPSSSHMMTMTDMMESMNTNLKGKTGDAFDKAFLAEMIVHHEGAVEMAKLALTNAQHQEIKDLAQAIIRAQNTEISSMKAWQTRWYNNQP